MRGIFKLAGVGILGVILAAVFIPKAFSPEPLQSSQPQPAPMMSLTLYFSLPDASSLKAEKREVALTTEPARTALDELLAGPKTNELVSVIPAGTKVQGIAIRHGVAYVDLSEDILNTPNRGSASESLIITSIVNTLTEFPDIEKVQILIAGKEVETLYGHMDLTQPMTRFR